MPTAESAEKDCRCERSLARRRTAAGCCVPEVDSWLVIVSTSSESSDLNRKCLELPFPVSSILHELTCTGGVSQGG